MFCMGEPDPATSLTVRSTERFGGRGAAFAFFRRRAMEETKLRDAGQAAVAGAGYGLA
jgi:Na+/glutamate symporter